MTEFKETLSLLHFDDLAKEMGETYQESGFTDATLSAAEGLAALSMEERTSLPFFTAWFYSEAGEIDEAFHWLEKGYLQRNPILTFLKVSPDFDPLRSDPRFDDLVRRIGLPE